MVTARELDIPTLVGLSAPAVTEVILQQVEAAGHAGVKPSHGYVTQRLIGNRPTIGQLADSLGMTQQGASKQITDLEHLGYVERVEDVDDQRIRYVQFTAAGQEMLDAGRRARAEIERALVERVGSATSMRRRSPEGAAGAHRRGRSGAEPIRTPAGHRP